MADDFTLDTMDLSGINLEGVELNLDPFAPPDPNTVKSSVGRGVDNMQRNLYSMAWEFGNAIDEDWITEKAAEGRDINIEEMAVYGQPKRLTEAEGIGDVLSIGLNTLAAGAPSIIGAGVAAAGSTVTTGTPIPGMAAWYAGQNIGEVSNRRAQLDPQYEGMGVGEVGVATGMTFVDTAAGGFLAKPFIKSLTKESIRKIGKDKTAEEMSKALMKGGVSGHMVEGMVNGAIVEASAGLLSEGMLELGSHKLSGVEVDTDAFIDQMKEVGLMSAALGGVMGGAGGYANFHSKAKLIDPSLQMNDPIFRAINNGIDAVKTNLEGGFLHETWNTVVGDVMAPLRSKLSKVPGGKKLLETFKGVEDAEQLHRDYRANHQMSFVEAVRTAQEHYGKGWVDKFSEEWHAGKTTKGTEAMRKHMDRFFDESVKRGLVNEESRIDLYSPSNLDSDYIKKNWNEFRDEVKAVYDKENIARKAENKAEIKIDDTLAEYKHALDNDDWSTFKDPMKKLTDEDLATSEARRATEEKLADDKLGRRKTGRVTSKFGNVEGHRVFDKMGNEFYNKWSKGGNKGQHLLDSLEGYGLRLAHRFAGVDKFGKSGEKLNRMINQTQEEMVSQHGEKLSAQDVERLYQTVDAFQGTHGRIQSKGWRAVRNVASVASNWATLPLVTLSSFVEILNVAAKTDMSMMVRAASHIGGRFGGNIMSKAAMRGPLGTTKTNAMQMQMAGQTWREATNIVAARLGDDVLSSGAQKWNNRLFKWNGLTAWTQATRAIGAEAMRLTLREDLATLKDIPHLAEGKAAMQRMREVGLTPEDIEFLNKPRTGDDADSARVNNLMGRAINRFNRTVALEPSFADRPLWMSNQKMWALSRLAGYPTMFTNTVLPMLGNRLRDTPNDVIEGLFIIGAQSVLGAGQMAARDVVAGRDFNERDMNDVLLTSFMRNSMPRPLQIGVDAVRGNRYGRSAAETALGPVIGTASELNRLGYRLFSGELDAGGFMEESIYKLTALGAFKKHWK